MTLISKKLLSSLCLGTMFLNLFFSFSYANNESLISLENSINQSNFGSHKSSQVINNEGNNTQSQAENKSYAPNKIIVKFRNETNDDDSYNIKNTLGLSSSNKLNIEDLGISNLGVLHFSEEINIESAIKKLGKIPNIEYAEPDYIREIFTLTGINTNDTFSIHQWHLRVIEADEAYKIYNDTGSKITVSVNDTGIDYVHPDLTGNLKDLSSGCVSDTGATTSCPNHGRNLEVGNPILFSGSETFDIDGHGTHVSGIIGAVGFNSIGTIGVTQNVEIISTRLDSYDDTGLFFHVSDTIRGINFAVRNGARVINASYGGPGFSTGSFNAIQAAMSSGVIFVAAAGNGGSDGVGDNNDNTPTYPASYNLSNIISVASVGPNDSLASYSNYGTSSVDIVAPGGQVSGGSGGILSTYPMITTTYSNSLDSTGGTTITGTGSDWGVVSGAYDTNSGTTNYASGVDSTITLSGSFNLSGSHASILEGIVACNFGSGSATSDDDNGDYLEFIISSGSTNTMLHRFSSDFSSSLIRKFIPTNLYGDNMRLSIRFVSDADNDVSRGCAIDNLRIRSSSKNNNGVYAYLQGTSQASPVVAGVVSMIWSYRPELTYTGVTDILYSSVDTLNLGNTSVRTSGRVNSRKAISEVIRNYGVTRSGNFEGSYFDAKLIDLSSRNINLSGSTISISGTGEVIRLQSGATITGTGTIRLGTGVSISNSGSTIFSSSNNLNVLFRNAIGNTISNSGQTVSGTGIYFGYVGTITGSELRLDVGDFYSGVLNNNQFIPINSNFTGAIPYEVFKNGTGSEGFSNQVKLSLLSGATQTIVFSQDNQAPTGSLSLLSGSHTNQTGTTIRLNISETGSYYLSGDLARTFTGNINSGNSDVSVELSSGDGTKNINVRYTDLGGNQSTLYTGSITLDQTNPSGTIEFLSGAYTNQTGTTVRLVSSEYPVDYVLSGNLVGTSTGTLNNSQNINIQLTSGDGNKILEVRYSDQASNSSNANSDNIILDQTIPTGSLSLLSGSHTNQTGTTIRLNISETGSYYLSGDLARTFTGNINSGNSDVSVELSSGDGTKNINVRYTDLGGNQSTLYTGSIILDQNSPSAPTNVSLNGGNTINSSNQSSINLTGSGNTSDSGSIVNYSITGSSGNPVSGTGLLQGNSFNINGINLSSLPDGQINHRLYFVDIAGNIGAVFSGTATKNVSSTITGAVNFLSGSHTNQTGTTINLNASEYPVSYSLSGNIVGTSTGNLNGSTNINVELSSGDGNKVINVIYSSGSTNSVQYSDNIILDQTIPTGSLSLLSGSHTNQTGTTIRLNISETGSYYLSGDLARTFTGNINSGNSDVSVELSSGDGTKNINVRYTDLGGNQSTLYTGSIILDQNSPSAPTNVSLNGGNTINSSNQSSINLTGSGNTSDSGSIVNYSITGSSGNPVSGTGLLQGNSFNINGINLSSLPDGQINHRLYFVDIAGNIGAVFSGTATKNVSSTITGAVNFLSGSHTNQTGTTINLNASEYPVSYSLSGNIVGTSTGNLNGSTNINVELSSGDGNKVINVIYSSGSTNSVQYSDNIILDQTIPTGSLSLLSGSHTNQTGTTIRLNISETGSYYLSGDLARTFTGNINSGNSDVSVELSSGDGTKNINVRYTDLGGNQSTLYTGSIILDQNSPSAPTNVSLNGGNTINSSNQSSINLTGSGNTSDSGSIVNYSITGSSGNPVSGTGLLQGNSFNINGINLSSLPDGQINHRLYFVDIAGNIGAVFSGTATKNVSSTITGAVNFLSGSHTNQTGTTINLNASEYPVSYSLSGNIVGTSTGNLNGSTNINVELSSGDGNKVINVIYSSGSTNSVQYSDNIILDQTIPTGSLSLLSGSHTNQTGTTIRLNISETGSYYLSGDLARTFTGNINSGNSDVSVELSSGDGTKNINVRYTDLGGNQSTLYTGSIILDQNSPSAPTNVSLNGGNTINSSNQSSINLTGSGNTSDSGSIVNYSITGSSGNPVSGTGLLQGNSFNINGINLSSLPDGQVTHRIYFTDLAGNIGNIATGTGLKNTQAGTGTISFLSGSHTNQTGTTIRLTASNYPINYSLSGNIVGTNTGNLTGDANVNIVLTDGDGSKLVEVTYSAGSDRVIFTGNIILDQTAPFINISSHSNNAQVEGSSVVFTGTISDSTGVNNFFINGSGVSISSGSWSRTINLNGGNNVISYSGTDTLGNISNGNLNIIRTPMVLDLYSIVEGTGSARIHFRSDLASTGQILFGTGTNNLNFTANFNSPGIVHQGNLFNLQEDTTYYYRARLILNPYTGSLSNLLSFKTSRLLDVSNACSSNNTLSGAAIFNGNGFSTTGFNCGNGTGNLRLNSPSSNDSIEMNLNGLEIVSSSWNGLFSPPEPVAFSGTFSQTGFVRNENLSTYNIGNIDREITLSGANATVRLGVDSSYSGQNLGIFRSTNNGGSYSYLTGCLVSSGICSFETNQLSLFLLTATIDSTPNNFSFNPANNVALNTLATSNSIVVNGINTGASISISGGEYRINSGNFVNSQGTVSNGDTITVRGTSASSNSSTTNITLTIGGVTGVFSITTLGTGTINFLSGSYTNQTGTTIRLTASNYPINYSLSGNIVGTNTGNITGDANVDIVLTDGDGNKLVEVTYSTGGNTTVFTGGIILDQTAPSINITSHSNNTQVEGSSIIFTGTISDSNGVSSLFINGSGVSISSGSWSRTINLNGGNNVISYSGTDIVGNTTGNQSHNIIRIPVVNNLYSVVNGTGSATIRFNSDITSTGQILYGTGTNNLNNTINLNTSGTSHQSIISSLQEGTTYYYRVRASSNGYVGSLSDINSFRTSFLLNFSGSLNINSTGSIVLSGNGFSSTGFTFNNNTGNIILNSANSIGSSVNINLNGLETISSSSWDGLFSPPEPVAFSGTFSQSGFTRNENLPTYNIGSNSSEIILSGASAGVTIGVDNSFNGQTLGIFRSTDNGGSYTYLTGCLVSSGVCSFETNQFSLFQLATANANDSTPNTFSFNSVSNVALNTLVTSNSITISGINTSANISVSGGEYSINSGAFTNSAGSVNNGNTINLRGTSSSSNSTTTNVTLTIGGITGVFSITTLNTTSSSGGGGGGGGRSGGSSVIPKPNCGQEHLVCKLSPGTKSFYRFYRKEGVSCNAGNLGKICDPNSSIYDRLPVTSLDKSDKFKNKIVTKVFEKYLKSFEKYGNKLFKISYLGEDIIKLNNNFGKIYNKSLNALKLIDKNLIDKDRESLKKNVKSFINYRKKLKNYKKFVEEKFGVISVQEIGKNNLTYIRYRNKNISKIQSFLFKRSFKTGNNKIILYKLSSKLSHILYIILTDKKLTKTEKKKLKFDGKSLLKGILKVFPNFLK